MGLTITLHLGDFVKRLPTRTLLRIAAINGLSLPERDVVEHQAIGEVAVVGNGQEFSTRAFLVTGHPAPQVLRVLGLVGAEGQYLIGKLLAIAKDHVAVQVVTTGHRGPFIADKRGKQAGGVIRFCRGRDQVPGSFRSCHAFIARHGINAAGLRCTPLIEGLAPLARPQELVDSPAILCRQDSRVPCCGQRRQTQVLRVVRDHDEIERQAQLRSDAGTGSDLLAQRKPVGLLRSERGAGKPGIGGKTGVHVGVTEE